jgi:hypothetical protein
MKMKIANIYVDGVIQSDMTQTVALLWDGDDEMVFMCVELLTNKQCADLLMMTTKDDEFDIEVAMEIEDGGGGLLYMELVEDRWYTNMGMEVRLRRVI